VIGRVPFAAWKTLTFVAALRCDRMSGSMMIKGPMNGKAFLAYVEQCLVPTLKRGTSSSWTTFRHTRSTEYAKR
jgi:hypothetical protein